MKGPGYERYLTVDLLYFQFSKGQMTHGRLGRVIVVVAFLDPGPALHDCLTYKSGILGIALDKGGNIAAIPIRDLLVEYRTYCGGIVRGENQRWRQQRQKEQAKSHPRSIYRFTRH